MTDKQILLAIGAGGLLVWFLASKAAAAVEAVADGAGGLVTGNNALTEGTPYEGFGVLGTLGSAVNEASGGFFQRVGEGLGGALYDWINPDESNLNEQMTKGIGEP